MDSNQLKHIQDFFSSIQDYIQCSEEEKIKLNEKIKLVNGHLESLVQVVKEQKDKIHKMQNFIDLNFETNPDMWKKTSNWKIKTYSDGHVEISQQIASQEQKSETSDDVLEDEIKPVDDSIQLAEEYRLSGNKFMESKNYEEAIKSYSLSIDKNPNNAIIFANRGAAYIHLKKFDEAIADGEKSIALDQFYVKAYSRLAVAYYSIGEYENAINVLEKGLKLDSTNTAMLHTLKLCKDALNKPKANDFLSGILSNPQLLNMVSNIANNMDPTMLNSITQSFGLGDKNITTEKMKNAVEKATQNPEEFTEVADFLKTALTTGNVEVPEKWKEKKTEEAIESRPKFDQL